jgi:hypothetical protein
VDATLLDFYFICGGWYFVHQGTKILFHYKVVSPGIGLYALFHPNFLSMHEGCFRAELGNQ